METPDPGGMPERDLDIDPWCLSFFLCPQPLHTDRVWDLRFDVPAHLAGTKTFNAFFFLSHYRVEIVIFFEVC